MSEEFDPKFFLKNVTNQPGVYRMYNANNTVIYVGKAKDLKKRLESYFRNKIFSKKTEALISMIHHIDVSVTHTETEALLLEQNYIKYYRPRYNILLKDDKSYPFIFLSNNLHPRLTMHRGTQNEKGEYFGPFPNNLAVRETLSLLQKIFPIRQCKNKMYYNRFRPCIQYQIGYCLGPCVKGLVDEEKYAQQVEYVRLFLSGKDDQVLTMLFDKMENASKKMAFEDAAKIRDQIQAVRLITENKFISNIGNDLDVIGISFQSKLICIHVLFINQGKILGSNSFFQKTSISTEYSKVIQNFISKFYLKRRNIHNLPNEIILDSYFNDKKLFIESLLERIGCKINVQIKPCGNYARYLKLAHTNAKSSLMTKLSLRSTICQRLKELALLLKIPKIKRIECFDISHTMGEQTVASCVVFNSKGPLRKEYRRYNILNITPCDDYAAMNKVLRFRYEKEIKKNKIPDVILIDGGKGHLRQAQAVFSDLNVSWNKEHPLLLGVSKGKDHKNRLETLFLKSKGNGIKLPSDSPALHVIQHIRNESHNHAISGHRRKKSKIKNTSTLEMIVGIGPKRRQALLKYMGGLQGLLNAKIEEILKVPGISHKLAEKIYYSLKR